MRGALGTTGTGASGPGAERGRAGPGRASLLGCSGIPRSRTTAGALLLSTACLPLLSTICPHRAGPPGPSCLPACRNSLAPARPKPTRVLGSNGCPGCLCFAPVLQVWARPAGPPACLFPLWACQHPSALGPNGRRRPARAARQGGWMGRAACPPLPRCPRLGGWPPGRPHSAPPSVRRGLLTDTPASRGSSCRPCAAVCLLSCAPAARGGRFRLACPGPERGREVGLPVLLLPCCSALGGLLLTAGTAGRVREHQ